MHDCVFFWPRSLLLTDGLLAAQQPGRAAQRRWRPASGGEGRPRTIPTSGKSICVLVMYINNMCSSSAVATPNWHVSFAALPWVLLLLLGANRRKYCWWWQVGGAPAAGARGPEVPRPVGRLEAACLPPRRPCLRRFCLGGDQPGGGGGGVLGRRRRRCRCVRPGAGSARRQKG